MAVKKTEIVEIKPLDIQEVQIELVGDTPMIMHAWSAKAKREILEKELKITKTKSRDIKNPIEDFASSMYWLSEMPDEFTNETMTEALEKADFGFPVTGFKQAAISAAYRMGWVKDKMSLRGVFFITPTHNTYYGGELIISQDMKSIHIESNCLKMEPMIKIYSDPPVMREDMVKVGMGSADIRYRGEFQNWKVKMSISYNRNGQYTIEQIINFINAGGRICGIRLGMARRGWVCCGIVRFVLARCGTAGEAWHGLAWRGKAGHGEARLGAVWQARQGMAWFGLVRQARQGGA